MKIPKFQKIPNPGDQYPEYQKSGIPEKRQKNISKPVLAKTNIQTYNFRNQPYPIQWSFLIDSAKMTVFQLSIFSRDLKN